LIFAILFEIFVYANFCGLSLIIYAIFGVLGVRVPLNFKQPFSSNNLIDFWKGWHISLSTVLKTLFYEPIRKRYGVGLAILGVYLASAMWHGVTLNFLLWGLFHAACFYATLFFLKRKIALLPPFILIVGVVVGRLIFSDSNTERLIDKLKFVYRDFQAVEGVLELGGSIKLSIALMVLFVLFEIVLKIADYLKKGTTNFIDYQLYSLFF